MGMAGIFGVLFPGKGNMPVEPPGQIEDTAKNSLPVEPSGEYSFLQKLLQCDETHAVAIAKQFEKITGETLENAELIPTDKKSRILQVETANKVYYLKISSVNVLREIREDSMTGDPIFQIIY